MSRLARITLAASRYGRANPTADEVIAEAWPKYHWWTDAYGNRCRPERSHIEGYHQDFAEAVRLAQTWRTQRVCKCCGDPITEQRGRRKYCTKPECRKASFTHRQPDHRPPVTAPTTAEERQRIVELYVGKQMSVLGVAAEVGRSPTAIYNALRAEGVERRSYAKKQKPVRRVYLAEGARKIA